MSDEENIPKISLADIGKPEMLTPDNNIQPVVSPPIVLESVESVISAGSDNNIPEPEKQIEPVSLSEQVKLTEPVVEASPFSALEMLKEEIKGDKPQIKTNNFAYIGKTRFFLSIILAFFIAGSTIAASSREENGKLAQTSLLAVSVQGDGKVEKKESNNWTPLKIGEVKSTKEGEQWKEVAEELTVNQNDGIRTDDKTRAQFIINGDTVIRLDKNSEMDWFSVKIGETGYEQVFLKLIKGKIWINNLLGKVELNILINKTIVIPDRASIGISYDATKGKVDVYADRQNAIISLLSKIIASKDELKESNSGIYLNKFLLTEGNKTSIFETKIDDRLLKLKYSKLVKEFPFSKMTDEEVAKEEWFVYGQIEDWKFINQIIEERIAQIKNKKISDYVFSSSSNTLFTYLRKTLTIDIKKRIEGEIKAVFDSLSKAEEEFLRGNLQTGETNLATFKTLFAEGNFAQNEVLSKWFREWIQKEVNYIMFVKLGSEMDKVRYTLKDAYLSLLPEEEKLQQELYFNRDNLVEIATLIRDKPSYYKVGINNAFNDYNVKWKGLAPKMAVKESQLNLLEEERQIIHSLFFRYPYFFEVKYYDTLSILEHLMLKIVVTPEDAQEMRLNFISDNLKTLARLVFLVKNRSVVLEPAIELGKMLINENQSFMPAEADRKVAVSAYFVEQMEEFKLLIEFFESPEFKKLRGQYNEEAFSAFKMTKQYFKDTQNYIAGIAKNQKGASRLNEEELKSLVKNDFAGEEMEANKIQSLQDPQSRLFDIQEIRYKNQIFSAKYDRDRKIAYDIVTGKDKINTAVLLSSLGEVILSFTTEGSQTVNTSEEPEVTNKGSTIEGVAKSWVLTDMELNKIVAKEENIEVLSLDKNLFKVKNAYTAKDKKTLFTFTYNLTTKEAFKAELKTLEEMKKIDGKYTLPNLKKKVEELSQPKKEESGG